MVIGPETSLLEQIRGRKHLWMLAFVLSSMILIVSFLLFRPTCDLMFYPANVVKDYASAWVWLFLIIGLILRIVFVQRGRLLSAFLLFAVLLSWALTTGLVDRRIPINEHRAVYRLNEVHEKVKPTGLRDKDVKEILAGLPENRLSKNYLFEYVPEIKGKLPTGHYVVTARPQCYCFSGRRSFLLEESGLIHFTPEDRAANFSDPILKDY